MYIDKSHTLEYNHLTNHTRVRIISPVLIMISRRRSEVMTKQTIRTLTCSIISAILFTTLSCSRTGVESADLVLTGGRIVTVDEDNPSAEALAVRGDILVAVGSKEDINAYIGDGTEIIDLEGRLAIPGFIESHAHFLGIGRAVLRLDLTKARKWEEIVEMVRAAAETSPPGAWIQGRGWHQEKWDEEPEPNVHGLPLHHSLSKVSPENPVLLIHASGHSAFVNRKAMELAGIDRTTPDPPGGEIVKDNSGEPIGVLRETSQQLVSRVKEESWNEAEVRRLVDLATGQCLSRGITSFQDAGSSLQSIILFKKLAEEDNLHLRLWVMIGEYNEKLAGDLIAHRMIGYGDNLLTVRAIKRYMDGALGTHSAWLTEPYSDLPTSSGLNTTSLESLSETAAFSVENGFQLCIHAIGDRANHETLNMYEKIFQQHPERSDLRWRIEHVQHLIPDDVERFAALGVIASIQGIHCTSDGPWVIKRLGQQRAEEGAYVWRKLLDSGAIVTNGTDSPVEDVDPIQCFYASVSRMLEDGSVFYPAQRMTRQEALKSYTLSAAFAAFEENIKGSLTPGKLADITVLSRDIMTIPENDIPGTEVIYTILGGKIVYRHSN
jgi:predicted amidohydrolase YtcJ